MVGVPHSSGCSLCRQRRVKCDQAEPECKQCRKYGRQCPGYQWTFRFQDEGPALERRRQSTRQSTSRARRKSTRGEGSGKKGTKSPKTIDTVRDNAIALMRRHASGVSADETFSPSLVRKSFMGQQPQIFGDFVSAAFPAVYFHNRFRAEGLDFVTHIFENFGSHAHLDASTCCLSSVYLADLTKDPALFKASRQLYGAALRSVTCALNTPEATSETMMCTMMMLSVYEMYAPTTKDAWVTHAEGVKRVMQIRGAQSYERGFPRSCYIAFRGFLIAAALYEDTPCFLEGEEWQNFASKIRSDDSKNPSEWSAFVYISELAFMEMAKCPRYVSEARAVNNSTPPNFIRDLVHRMRDMSKRLVTITAELTSRISAHSQRQQGSVRRPVPRVVPETSPSLLLRGERSTIATLNQLTDQLTDMIKPRVKDVPALTPDSSNSTHGPSSPRHADSPETPKTFSLPFRVVSELGHSPANTSDKNDPRAVIWLDRAASSIGKLGKEIG